MMILVSVKLTNSCRFWMAAVTCLVNGGGKFYRYYCVVLPVLNETQVIWSQHSAADVYCVSSVQSLGANLILPAAGCHDTWNTYPRTSLWHNARRSYGWNDLCNSFCARIHTAGWPNWFTNVRIICIWTMEELCISKRFSYVFSSGG
jgi:hypothetical protein